MGKFNPPKDQVFVPGKQPEQKEQPKGAFNIPESQVFAPGKTIDPSAEFKKKPKGLVPIWSFSTLMDYEACPYRAYLHGYKKVKVDESENTALVRGNRVHDAGEHYVDGTIDEVPPEFGDFAGDMDYLREEHQAGKVELEEKWGVDKNWNTCTWKEYDRLWGRIKLDAFVHVTDKYALVVDYKTGRKFGNEFKHNTQGMTYAIAAFNRYLDLQTVKTEFWYVDHNEKLEQTYTRQQVNILQNRFTERALKFTTATQFPAKPSKTNCAYCKFNKSGHCEYAEGEYKGK